MSPAIPSSPDTVRGGTAACGAAAPQDDHCPLVSIVVPVWNAEKYLPACLDSIRAQTMPDWECILVDDGSPDTSGAVCDEYAARDSRFTVIHKENGGVSGARNAGLEAARGKWVAFCDSDDRMSPVLLETALDLQTRYPDRAVLWNFTRSADGLTAAKAEQPPVLLRTRWQMETVARDTVLMNPVWNKLFERERLQRHALRFDTGMGAAELDFKSEDSDFCARYYARCFDCPEDTVKMVYCTQPLYCWSVENENSLLHQLIRLQNENPAARESVESAPEAGYLANILAECSLRVDGDPDFWDNPPSVIARAATHYFRCIGYGLWCGERLGEPMPSLNGQTALNKLLAWSSKNRLFSPYWLPLRMKLPKLAARLYDQDQRRTAWYYRYCQLMRLSLCRGWKDSGQF